MTQLPARGSLDGNGYRPDIDGLRAVAVLMVLAFHAGSLAPGGYVGVDVFFVLSGFLITRIVLKEIDSGRWLLQSFRVSHDDIVILRMNAEGVEQGIIDWLTDDPSAAKSVQIVMGSTGDIKKCFGKDAEVAAQSRLAKAGIPFIYFTSNPGSWQPALDSLVAFLGTAFPPASGDTISPKSRANHEQN
jgi:hypothetical protein